MLYLNASSERRNEDIWMLPNPEVIIFTPLLPPSLFQWIAPSSPQQSLGTIPSIWFFFLSGNGGYCLISSLSPTFYYSSQIPINSVSHTALEAGDFTQNSHSLQVQVTASLGLLITSELAFWCKPIFTWVFLITDMWSFHYNVHHSHRNAW